MDMHGEIGYISHGDDDVFLARVTIGKPHDVTIGPRQSHVLLRILDGDARVTTSGSRTFAMRPGEAFLLEADSAYSFTTTTRNAELLHLRTGYLDEVEAGRGRSANRPGGKFLELSPSDSRLVPITTALQELGPKIRDKSVTGRRRQEMNQRFADIFLTSFTRSRADADRHLTAALAYIDANAEKDLTVQHIADAAGVTTRGLQDLFRRSLAIPPIAYLRQVRLDRTHQELKRLGLEANEKDLRRLRVYTVAERWQLTHPGRFSVDYKARFGESPSQTLKRGQR